MQHRTPTGTSPTRLARSTPAGWQTAFWGLGERTANRRNVRKGDAVVFYIARPESAFGGTARLSSDSFTLTSDQQEQYGHDSDFFTADYGVLLDNIVTWETSRAVAALAHELELIENPEQWWAYLQGGIRQISEADYAKILSGVAEQPPAQAQPAVSESLFALEAHLEDFIEKNWDKIDWGAPLQLYSDGDQNGRQYPAGTWSIDFLAVDQKTRDLVVLELKRGQTSDSTIGQVLRYMSWIREHLAQPDQEVRGIIVASDIDEALQYAAKGLAGVEVMTYRVTFTLARVAI